MKKSFVMVLVISLFLVGSAFAWPFGGPYVQNDGGKALGVASGAEYDSVTCTFTARSVKFIPIHGTAPATGIATITFPANTFTSASTYFIIASPRGVTTQAYAIGVTRETATKAQLFLDVSSDLTFDGFAIGW
jgi:hypothetical protein